MDAGLFSKGSMFLIVAEEEDYFVKINDFLKRITQDYEKVCYLCLNKLYSDVLKVIQENNLDINKFFFIDVLTSHYDIQPKKTNNCIFLKSPSNASELSEAIEKAINEQKCQEIFIDSISSLLAYQQSFNIIKLTHDLKDGKISQLKSLKKSIIVTLKNHSALEKESQNLLEDLSMFADEVLDLD